MLSTPSLVLPLTLTDAISTCSAAARLARIAATWGKSFGRSAITVTSTLPTRKPAPCTRGHGRAEQLEAVGIFPGGVAVGKQRADVAERGGTEHGVGDGVADDVGIGMAFEAEFEGDTHAGEDESAIRHEAVQVITGADADGREDAVGRGRARGREVGGGGDLHVGRLARHDLHGPAAPFDEGRFVGGRLSAGGGQGAARARPG